jgi:hypothetical protein
MKNTNKHYNCLGCPQCSAPLYDSLIELEMRYPVKTVKCDNCDFIGFRKGWELLNKEQENAYRQLQRTGQVAKGQVSTYQGTPVTRY